MKKYKVYLALLMISLFGTDLTDFALSVWILEQPGSSVSSYSLVWFFEAVPGVVLAPFIGSMVDRWDKKKMIVGGQIVAGIGSLALMALHNFGMLQAWHIMIVAGIGSVASMFVFDAFQASTSTLVSKDKLVKANGMSSTMYGVIQMGVPILAPVLYKLIGIRSIFFIDVITFSIAVVAFLLLGFVVVARSSDKFNFKEDFKLVRAFVKEKAGFSYFIFFFFLMSFLIGLISVLFTPLVLDFSNEYILGIIMSCAGVGALLGGVLMSVLKEFKRPMNAVINLGYLKSLVFLGCFFFMNQYTLAVAGVIIMALFTIEMVISEAFLQTLIPVEKQGRIMGTVSFLVGITAPIAYLIVGPLVDYVKLFVDHFFPDLYTHYPGTNLTAAIAVVFGLCGVFLIIISFVYKQKKAFNNLDDLYVKELEMLKENKDLTPVVNGAEIVDQIENHSEEEKEKEVGV
ncbi:MFS transporter [Aquimarina muelleri]|uniref:MFS transporter n=1 Tax=Aquimarina muelleri TaxID=279356 RepID=A0A918N4Z0_9FLAO|nr:MFS transporter [Aquimarina muelleri]MCX2761985.1 MFS transporter [Aquimarina muelleri]GGX25165.1 MFS transporter [Aquimarina muelleri]